MKQRSRALYISALCLLVGLIGGCGWQLRGSGDIADNIGSLHITARNPSDKLVTELRRALLANDIQISAHASEARLSLVILDQRSQRDTASLTASARVAEYRLAEEVDYLILSSDGQQLVAPETASSERVFEFNEEDVLARDNEVRLLKQEMRRELIRQMLNRLRFASHNTDHAS